MSITLNRRSFLVGSGVSTTALTTPAYGLVKSSPTPENPIRLMFNENPYGPGPKAKAAALRALKKEGALYPYDIALTAKIAKYYDLGPEHVTLSSGSTEMLMAATMAWGREGTILAPAPTYSPQFSYAASKGVQIKRVPLDDRFANDLDGLAAQTGPDTSMVYICNPNNPTGVLVDPDRLRDFCKTIGKNTTVIVDEAYNEIVDNPRKNSMIDLVRDEENIIIIKTFSKIYGLAGLRVGFALGRADLIRKLRADVMSWVPGPAIAAADASLDDHAFYTFSRKKIIEGREKLYATFEKAGLDYVPSQTNFVFANVGRNANDFAADIRKRGIHVRGADYPPYHNYSRISAGKLKDLDYFARVLPKVISG